MANKEINVNPNDVYQEIMTENMQLKLVNAQLKSLVKQYEQRDAEQAEDAVEPAEGE